MLFRIGRSGSLLLTCCCIKCEKTCWGTIWTCFMGLQVEIKDMKHGRLINRYCWNFITERSLMSIEIYSLRFNVNGMCSGTAIQKSAGATKERQNMWLILIRKTAPDVYNAANIDNEIPCTFVWNHNLCKHHTSYSLTENDIWHMNLLTT